MTSHPLENEVGPRRLSADECAEGDFIASIEGSTGQRALVISTPGGTAFYGFCPQCGCQGPLVSSKACAQRAVDEHNEENRS